MLSAGFCVLSTPVLDSSGWARRESKAELRAPGRELLCPKKEEGITRRDIDPGCTR